MMKSDNGISGTIAYEMTQNGDLIGIKMAENANWEKTLPTRKLVEWD